MADREMPEDPQPTSRRQFLKRAGLAGAVAAAAPVARLASTWAAGGAQAPAHAGHGKTRPRRWVMVIDLAACDGCKKCTYACQKEHFVPFNQQWIKVYENMANNAYDRYNFPVPCMQCEDAPCVKVCPVGATYHTDEGIVQVDHNQCVGCRFCMAACPYGVRSFNWTEPSHSPQEKFVQYSPEFPVPHRKGTVEKCMFCAHRVKMGRLPGCVEACHEAGHDAIYFGDANENLVTNGKEVVKLTQLLAQGHGYKYKEELGTHPRVYYLLPSRETKKA
ncbi:MAG: 4Fe-4S dicluster domain-containing protein [Armatimonadetes bacterium]|nr:4Fe-4S dicluster domain-containing protein [Armatimonadota bacterium]